MADKQQADDDDWSVPCSDDEKYEITPEDMKELFEKIARNEPLVLEWKCPGRRSPTPEPPVESAAVEVKMEVDVEPQQKYVFGFSVFNDIHLAGFESVSYVFFSTLDVISCVHCYCILLVYKCHDC